MTITADQVAAWCQALARGPSDAAETAALLGLTGTPSAMGSAWELQPLPAGTTQVLLMKGTGGVGVVDINLVAPIARAELDQWFGEGNPLPRTGPGRRHKVAYQVRVPGAPFSIALIAGFDDPPGAPTATASNLVLRRDQL